jgi:hypothetical protein
VIKYLLQHYSLLPTTHGSLTRLNNNSTNCPFLARPPGVGGRKEGNPRDRVHAWGRGKFKDLSQGWIKRAGNPLRHNRANANALLKLIILIITIIMSHVRGYVTNNNGVWIE